MRPILAAVALLGLASPAGAEDGQIGSFSQGSVRITVSVAPRAWVSTSPGKVGTLCIATGGSFDIVSAADSSPVVWSPQEGNCSSNGTAVRLASASEDNTILIRPE
jgi:hypothetical protein